MKHLKTLGLGLCLAFSAPILNAQISGCSNPVNLVTNGNFNAALTVTTTAYALPGVGDNCDEGQYVIGDNFQDKCTGWSSITGTGDFMIVDSYNGTAPSGSTDTTVWLQTISGILPNTTYTFALDKNDYYGNTTDGLIVIINGTVISGNFADLATAKTWQNTSTTWNSGPSAPSSIDIELRVNHTPSSNDFAIDNIFFGTCGDCDVTADFSYNQNGNTCAYNFTSTSVSGNPNTTIIGYSWDFGDGATSNDANPNHAYATAGGYTACLTVLSINAQGDCCTDEFCEDIVNECEAEPCTFDGSIGFNPSGCTYYFNSGVSGSSPIVGYFWSFGDGSTSTLENPNHTYATGGGYSVCLTVYSLYEGDCCSETFCTEVDVKCEASEEKTIRSNSSTAQNTASNQSAFNLYPNPSSGKLNIEFKKSMDDTSAKIAIYDATGRLILEQETEVAQGKILIDTQSLKAGVHILKIIAGNTQYHDTFLVE